MASVVALEILEPKVVVAVLDEKKIENYEGFISARVPPAHFRVSSSVLDQSDFNGVDLDSLSDVVLITPINRCRYINKILEAANTAVKKEATLILRFETNNQRSRRLYEKYPVGLNYPVLLADFVIHRFFPKFILTKAAYFSVTKGRTRVLSLAEPLGRLISCGFKIKEVEEVGKMTYVSATKVQEPVFDQAPTYGPIVKMNRVGYGGKLIKVYKIRTMHPFAEYLQDYMMQTNGLAKSGKFKHDFRVTGWGRFLRKTWLDELPMIANWWKGDLKLIGVRPITEHYLSQYPEDLIAKRRKVKPGLIPPFYADLPGSAEEIVISELNYLDAYAESPILTDLKYLRRAVFNIVFRGARSS